MDRQPCQPGMTHDCVEGRRGAPGRALFVEPKIRAARAYRQSRLCHQPIDRRALRPGRMALSWLLGKTLQRHAAQQALIRADDHDAWEIAMVHNQTRWCPVGWQAKWQEDLK